MQTSKLTIVSRNDNFRNPEFADEIAAGRIPGVPGKDYPINSIAGE